MGECSNNGDPQDPQRAWFQSSAHGGGGDIDSPGTGFSFNLEARCNCSIEAWRRWPCPPLVPEQTLSLTLSMNRVDLGTKGIWLIDANNNSVFNFTGCGDGYRVNNVAPTINGTEVDVHAKSSFAMNFTALPGNQMHVVICRVTPPPLVQVVFTEILPMPPIYAFALFAKDQCPDNDANDLSTNSFTIYA